MSDEAILKDSLQEEESNEKEAICDETEENKSETLLTLFWKPE